MAQISEEAHETAKNADGAVHEAVDKWLEAAKILSATNMAAITYRSLPSEELDDSDPRSMRPNEPDVMVLHLPTLSPREEVVPECGLLDPNVMTAILPSDEDPTEALGQGHLEYEKCEVCYGDD